jgi:DNA-binding beta-propeller fold protein YncE
MIKKSEAFDYIENLKFTPDGKVVYIASSGGKWNCTDGGEVCQYSGGKWYVVVNGKKGEGFDYIENVEFTPDGKNLVYISSNGGKWKWGFGYSGGKWYVVVNGKKGEGFDYIDEYSLEFTPDGKVVYIASNGGKRNDDGRYSGGKWYVVVNGKKGEGFDYIDKWYDRYSLQFTPDGKVAYIANNGGKWIDDGVYYKYSGGKYFIIVDKQKSKPYDKVYDFKYLKAKDTFIALAQDGNDILLVEYVNTK